MHSFGVISINSFLQITPKKCLVDSSLANERAMENLFVIISFFLGSSCESIREFYQKSGEVHHLAEKTVFIFNRRELGMNFFLHKGDETITVDRHGMPIVILKEIWTNDSFLANSTPHSNFLCTDF